MTNIIIRIFLIERTLGIVGLFINRSRNYFVVKDRIIFWLDAHVLYFGLAKSLQVKYDCDIFAVIDITDKPKKFFQEQKLVQYKKTWFYHDHISKTRQKPDLNYLRSIEEKYGINLWLLAYNERLFYEYNRYYKFSADEVLSIVEQECRLFEEVLDDVKPDFLIMKTTDLHQNHLFYEICKARGIKILMLGPTSFGYRRMFSQEIYKVDFVEGLPEFSGTRRSMEDLLKYYKGYDMFKQVKEYDTRFQNSKSKLIKAFLKFLFSSNTNEQTHWTYYGRTKQKVIIKEIIYLLKKKYREIFINRNFDRKIEDKEPFVYFPLHIDQERVLLVGAPFYTNQIEVIKNIVQSLPVGCKLIVKEHPDMVTRGWRPTSYYKQIMNFPNVHLIHWSVSPEEILKKCSLVITIAGTASLEAAFHGKPSIILSDMGFGVLPSVNRLCTMEEFPQTIRTSFQKTVDPKDLNNFVNLIEGNSFEFDESRIMLEILERFYVGGFLADVEIQNSEMESFLKDNDSVFDKLTMECIKKIKQHKERGSKST